MRALSAAALFVMLGTGFSGGQQASPPAAPPQAPAQPTRVKVYSVGPGVTAPELLPLNMPPFPDEKCKKRQEVDGMVVLSALVDTTGTPRNVMFLRPLGTDLDKFAVLTVEADRFKPGERDGSPVVVAQSVEVSLQTCIEEKKDDGGKKTYSLRLLSQPVQKFGSLLESAKEAALTLEEPPSGDFGDVAPPILRVEHGVSAPVLLSSVDPEFTDAARKAKHQGICVLSIIVDAHGMPQNIKVVRALGMGLDEKAVEAVGRYRFKPAMKDRMPIPVRMNVEIDFHLVDY
jgi:TonB family protein